MGLKKGFCILIITSTAFLTITNLFDEKQVDRSSRNLRIQSVENYGDDTVEIELRPTCNIPSLDPFNEYALGLIAEVELEHSKPKCLDNAQVRFNVQDTTSTLVQVDPSTAFWENLSCCFVGFRLNDNSTGIPAKSSDSKEFCVPISLGSPKTQIAEIYEYIDVQCRNKDSLKMIYQDQFSFLRVDPIKELRSNSKVGKPNNRDLLNIIFIGLDSVSHVNFQRFMPKTRSYLTKTLSAIEFWGRNVVSWGTQGNLLAALTGCRLGRGMNPESYAENCRLIWTQFAELGYRTFRSEDDDGLYKHFYPTLRENRTGSPATDYDWLPYIYERQRRNKLNGDHLHFGCFDHQWVPNLIVRRVAQVARHYGPNNRDKPYFKFVWTATGTHEVIGYTRFMDEPFFELFKELHENNLLNNTALIFMSDHGMNYGSYSRTYEGSTEFRMPFLYMVFPKWFRNKYSVATRNLRRNSHRLTTPFDLHETLLDLLDPEHRISKKTITKPSRNSGISLFQDIPLNRSCEVANIPYQYCICNTKIPIPNPDKNSHVVRIAERLVAHLNLNLGKYKECAQLQLDQILLARNGYTGESAVKPLFYDVVVHALPNRAYFETSAMITGNDTVAITGRIIRVNAYGNQSSCLDKYEQNEIAWIRSVCYCI